jgi:flagellar motility protein MotE (MotC chaperone)
MAKSKKSSPVGIILVVLMILVVIPLASLTGFYFISDAFQLEANKILSQVPGPLGDHFKSYPTREELGAQISMISEYLLEVELDHAADKLELIKKEDASMYDEVIKGMIRLNPNRSERVLEVLRKRSLKPNVIASTVDEITKEVDQTYVDSSANLKNMSLAMRVAEIKRIIDQEVDSHFMAANILSNFDARDAINILKRLDPNDRMTILDYLPEAKRKQWSDLLAQEDIRFGALDLALTLMKKDSPVKNAVLLGPSSTYTLEEKVYIFSNLDTKEAGKILSLIADEPLTSSLIQKIKETEILDRGTDKITEDILKSLKIYTEYDDNIKELVDIYNGISDDRAAAMLRELYWRSSTFKSYTLKNGESIIISSSDVALEVLRQFNTKKKAAILSLYDDQLATEISTQLALPRE